MLLSLSDIVKTYCQGKLPVPVLKNVSLEVERGEYVAIMGPSGSGKTTLMNIIGCLDKPTSGSYKFDGDDLLSLDDNKLADIRLNRIGFVFQSYHMMQKETAISNVMLPLVYAGVKKKDRVTRAEEALSRVGLSDRKNFYPNQMSGGQNQRVAIARAIVNHPDLLLADEPTGALDSVSGEQVMELFHSLNEEGITIVMITHEQSIADHADRILYIRDGEFVDKDGKKVSHEE